MILNDLARDGQAETGAVVLARTDKWLEQGLSHDIRNAGAIVRYTALEKITCGIDLYRHAPRGGRRLARIQKQIEERALKFLAIKASPGAAVCFQGDVVIPKFRIRLHSVNRMMYEVGEILFADSQRPMLA